MDRDQMTEQYCPWRKDKPKKYCGLSQFNKREIDEIWFVFGLFFGIFIALGIVKVF